MLHASYLVQKSTMKGKSMDPPIHNATSLLPAWFDCVLTLRGDSEAPERECEIADRISYFSPYWKCYREGCLWIESSENASRFISRPKKHDGIKIDGSANPECRQHAEQRDLAVFSLCEAIPKLQNANMKLRIAFLIFLCVRNVIEKVACE